MHSLAKVMEIVFDTPLFWLAPFFVFVALRRRAMRVTPVASLLFALASLCFFYGIALIWALRDGLGPDSVNSQGATAISRFVSGLKESIAVVLFISVFPLFSGLSLYFLNKGRRQND